MWGFEPWGLALVALIAAGLAFQSARWAANPQYGLYTLVTVLMIAGAVGYFAGIGQSRPSCGHLDPRTGDAPDPEDVQACVEAQTRAEASLSPAGRAALNEYRAMAAQRATSAFVVVAVGGVVGVAYGYSQRIRNA